MTISGNAVIQNSNWYRQNQTCTGTVDVSEVISFTMSWGSYDTTGYSNNATYSNFSRLITPLTSNGLARMGNYGICTFSSFSLNVQTECRISTVGSYKYYLADNIFLPEVQGPQLYSTSLGISYAFGTFRKVVTTPSAFDGIYAYTDSSTFTKLMISGDRFVYIEANDLDSSRIAVASGSLSTGPVVSLPIGTMTFTVTTKSKILQPRLASGATDLNNGAICGFTDYANGVVKNILTSGTCTQNPANLMMKLAGSALHFRLGNLPLPTVFPSLILYAPWKYSP